MAHPKTITLGEIRGELQGLLALPDDTMVTFGNGDLTWYRIKNRGATVGPQTMQIAFNEVYSVVLAAGDESD